MSNAAANRFVAIVLLGIAILSAVALKVSLSTFSAEPETHVPADHRVVHQIGELL